MNSALKHLLKDLQQELNPNAAPKKPTLTPVDNNQIFKQKLKEKTLSAMVHEWLECYWEMIKGVPPNDLYLRVFQEMEKGLITNVLTHTAGNKSKAARILGISRTSLDKKISMYQIII